MSNYTEWSDRELREEIYDRDILTGDIEEYDTEELIQALQEDDVDRITGRTRRCK